MNTSEIKKRIADLIGGSYKFGSYMTKDGKEFKIHGEKMEIGMPVYIVTPEGEIPVMDGEYELENNMKLKIENAEISNIADGLNVEGTPVDEISEDSPELETFDEAELADGTIVGTDGDFELGKTLYVKDESDNWVKAPEGSHTTKSGITLVLDSESVIVGLKRPDEAGVGSLAEMEANSLLEAFASMLEEIRNELSAMKNKNQELEEKFSKFSGEPAGEKIYDRKGFFSQVEENRNLKMEQIASMRGIKK
jgi:hypothetical protein